MLNSAYITLIPKKSDAEQVKDFRRISLVHSFAKLVTKCLANRLASRLDHMGRVCEGGSGRPCARGVQAPLFAVLARERARLSRAKNDAAAGL
jgi:hypothetical protein